MIIRNDHEDEDEDEDGECCGGTGHVYDCDAREPAYDIGDLLCRSQCDGCCPNGHKPHGFQAEQDEAGRKAYSFLRGGIGGGRR